MLCVLCPYKKRAPLTLVSNITGGGYMILEEGRINKSVPIPLYYQLKEAILDEIEKGNYESGSVIPTEKSISDFYGISRITVRQAITELVQEGWLYRIKSKGTFVAQKKIQQDFIQKLETYEEQMKRLGVVPHTEVMEFRVVYAPHVVAEKLKIEEKSEVIYLYRKRFADDIPIVLVETYLPLADCEFILDRDMQKESLYKNLGKTENTRIHCVKRVVEAVEACSNDVKLLNIKKGKPIQKFETIGYNVFGKPIEYSVARYRGDYNRFEVTIMADTR